MIRRLVQRAGGFAAARFWLRGCRLGSLVHAGGRVHAEPRGRIEVGDRVQLFGGMIPTELVAEEGAELVLGPRSIVNYGVSLRAAKSIRLGAGCWLGTLVLIRDRDADGAAPVAIGDGVWLAHGVVVGPGVRIGDRSVVSAGSVVLSDVPPDSLASGNPARCVPLRFFAGRRSA